MLITVMRSKLHRLTVTEADLNYIGSITLDPDLLEASGLVEGEKVQIVNVNNGERLRLTPLKVKEDQAKYVLTALQQDAVNLEIS